MGMDYAHAVRHLFEKSGMMIVFTITRRFRSRNNIGIHII